MRQITTPDEIPGCMKVILERLHRQINLGGIPRNLLCYVVSAKDETPWMSMHCDDAPEGSLMGEWLDEVCVQKAAEGADFVCGIANVMAASVEPPDSEVFTRERTGHVQGVEYSQIDPNVIKEMREVMIVYFHTPTKEYVACGFIEDDVIVRWTIRESDVMMGGTVGIMSSIYPRAMALVNTN